MRVSRGGRRRRAEVEEGGREGGRGRTKFWLGDEKMGMGKHKVK